MNRWNAECTESTDASFKEGPCPELWETERLYQVGKDLEQPSSECQDEKEEKDASKDPDPNQKMQQPQDRQIEKYTENRI